MGSRRQSPKEAEEQAAVPQRGQEQQHESKRAPQTPQDWEKEEDAVEEDMRKARHEEEEEHWIRRIKKTKGQTGEQRRKKPRSKQLAQHEAIAERAYAQEARARDSK